jgi:hypothetical protein
MVINKSTSSQSAAISLANFRPQSRAQVWQLTSSNVITRRSDVAVSSSGSISTTVPAQSITLFVVPAL